MIIFALLLTVVLSMPAMEMHNYQKEAAAKRATTQTILKKIRGGCVGENMTTLLDTVEKKDPKNWALQAYIVGKTAHIMETYPYYPPGETLSKFQYIACRANFPHDKEGQQVAEVMRAYWREKVDPITNSITSKYHRALRFLLTMKEPLYSSHAAVACSKGDTESLQLLLAAGCPTHNNGKEIYDQPLVHAAKHAEETDDFRLLTMLIPHENLKATFNYGLQDVTVADYLKKEWRVLSPHQSYIIHLLSAAS